MGRISRRKFLAISATAAASVAAGAEPEPPALTVVDQVAFNGQTRRLKLLRDGRLVAALLFPTDYPTHFRLKPVLYPVCTPRGLPVTEGNPYCFIHQQSITCGHGRVRDEADALPVDFYRHLHAPEPGRPDRWHRGFNLFQLGPSGLQAVQNASWQTGATIVVELDLAWQTRPGPEQEARTLLFEKRRYRIAQSGLATIVDQHSRLSVAAGRVSLLADRHSLVSVRAHDLLDVEDGGTMRDSEGRLNPSGNYCDTAGERRAPRWVDTSGVLGAHEAGLTLIAHPKNVRNQFYVREYGLMTVSAMLTEDVHITPENPFLFAARVAAHDGPLAPRLADRWHADFAATPL